MRSRSETASEHLCRGVPVAAPAESAGEIRAALQGKSFDCAAAVAVCREGVLAGLLPLERLLAAPEGAVASDLMDADTPVVGPEMDQEKAALKAVEHGQSVLAVVDRDGRFLGLIPPRKLLSVLLAEHQEDMARLSGIMDGASFARTALQESILRGLMHRLPWLVVGLGGAIAAAEVVGSFEEELRGDVLLALFLPGIVYLADAVGTQTETLVVRGLSVGIPITRVVAREVLMGVLIGLGLAASSFPLSLWRWGRPALSLVLSIALLAACSGATILAMGLPWAFHRLGRDPAFGSGPLATILQDILSIAIYLTVARWLLA